MEKPRRKRSSPGALPLEYVQWFDNAAPSDNGRALLDTSVIELETIGWLVNEDERQIVLASEIESHEDYMNQEMKYSQIFKVNIIERRRVGDVALYWKENTNPP